MIDKRFIQPDVSNNTLLAREFQDPDALAYLVLGLAVYDWGGLLNVPPPVWTGAPILPGGVALMVLVRAGRSCSGIRHLCRVIVWITLPFVLYPVIPHVTPLVFR